MFYHKIKNVKNTLLHVVFSTLFSVCHTCSNTASGVWYIKYILVVSWRKSVLKLRTENRSCFFLSTANPWFQNLQASIWHLNTQKYIKNLFNLAKKKRVLIQKNHSTFDGQNSLFNCVRNFWQKLLWICLLWFIFVWIFTRNMFSIDHYICMY